MTRSTRTCESCDRTPSSRTTRIALLVLVPLAVLLGARAISWAVPKVWSSGETLTAADLNSRFQALDQVVAASSWVACGALEDLRNGTVKCELNNYPADQYEYGFKYNGPDVSVADCLFWNVGMRVVNRQPYIVLSDNPTDGTMQLGGAMFYTETNAADDDIPASCASGLWRHHYWEIVGGSVVLSGTNGCLNQPLFCRHR